MQEKKLLRISLGKKSLAILLISIAEAATEAVVAKSVFALVMFWYDNIFAKQNWAEMEVLCYDTTILIYDW